MDLAILRLPIKMTASRGCHTYFQSKVLNINLKLILPFTSRIEQWDLWLKWLSKTKTISKITIYHC